MACEVRDASLADAPVIAAFNAAMALETENVTLDPERVRAGVEAILADPAKGFYLAAFDGGDIAGQLLVTFEWSDWRNGAFWWIQSVYVKPGYRRRGVYRRLYEAVRERARLAPDVCGLRLYVDRANGPAKAVYAALGMRRSEYEMFEVDFVLERPEVS
jgi:GNAT superfamily N-acetyltransferase